MSGDIVDLPVRKCPACTAIFIQDDRMYLDPQICPRCGSDLTSDAGGGGTIRTAFGYVVVLGTEDGFAMATQNAEAFPISWSRYG